MSLYTLPITSDKSVFNVNLFRLTPFRTAKYMTRSKNGGLTLQPALVNSDPNIFDQLFFYTEDQLQQWPAGLDLSRMVISGPLDTVSNFSTELLVSIGKLTNMTDYVSSKFQTTGVLPNIGVVFNQLSMVTSASIQMLFLPIVQPDVLEAPLIVGNLVFTDSATGDAVVVGFAPDPMNSKLSVITLQPFSGVIDPTAVNLFWEFERYPRDLSVVESTPLTLAQMLNGAVVGLGSMQVPNPYYGPIDRFIPGSIQACGIGTGGFVDYAWSRVGSVCETAVDILLEGQIFPGSPYSTALLPDSIEAQLSVYNNDTIIGDLNTMMSVPLAKQLNFPLQFVFPLPEAAPDVFYMIYRSDDCEMIMRRARNLGEGTMNPPFNFVYPGLQPMPLTFWIDPDAGFQLDNFLYTANFSLIDQINVNMSTTHTITPTDYAQRCDSARFRMAGVRSSQQLTLQQFDLAFGGGRPEVQEEAFLHSFEPRRQLPLMEVVISTLNYTPADPSDDGFASGVLTLCPFLINNVAIDPWCKQEPTAGAFNTVFHRWINGSMPPACDLLVDGNLDYTFTHLAFVNLKALPANPNDPDCFPGLITGMRYAAKPGPTGSPTLPISRFTLNILFDQPGELIQEYFLAKDSLDKHCCVSRKPPAFCQLIQDDNGFPLVYGTPTCTTFIRDFCTSRFEPVNVDSCSCIFPRSSGVQGLPTGVDYCFSGVCSSGGYKTSQQKLNQVCSSSICASGININASMVVFVGRQTLNCNGAVQSNVILRDDFPAFPGLVGEQQRKQTVFQSEKMVPILSIAGAITLVLCVIIIIIALFKQPQRVATVSG